VGLSKLFDQAMKAHQAGRRGQAYDLYRQVLAREPDNLEALFHYGCLIRESGQLEAARDIFAEAIAVAPDVAVFHAAIGDAHQELGEVEAAIDAFSAAARLDGGSAPTLTALGLCYLQSGKAEAAVLQFRKARENDPAFAPAAINLGIALYRAAGATGDDGLVAQAIEACEEATRLAPDNAGAWANLGAALYAHRRFDAARKACQAAREIAPDQRLAADTLANALIALGDFDQAIGVLEQAVGKTPDNLERLRKLGSLYFQRNRHYEATRVFHHVAELTPGDGRVQVILATIYAEASQFAPAVESYRAAIGCGLGEAAVYRGLGENLARLGELEAAREAFARMLEMAPDDAAAKFAVAALSEEGIDAAPEDYVSELFDRFAETFDAQLTGQLDYRTPALLRGAIDAALAGDGEKLHILDLGCGTGLSGQAVQSLASALVGSDLSPGMIEKARGRDIYSELRVESIDHTLAALSGPFDLVLAADVFVYIGRLDPLFEAVKGRLAPGGLFAFSTERGGGQDFAVGTTFRFSHSAAYIARLARASGLSIVSQSDETIRTESGQPVTGGIYVLRNDTA